ncbi:MAG TPA: DUF1579 family protein, partial [Polyangiaceae bacterium]|nr:DUF1579 family protein [Polyangiaceae bacterium]
MTHSATDAAPGLEALRPLVGKWHIEGKQLESPLGPAAPFVAVETFEWLEGGRFLVHRLEGKLGDRPAACVEILGLNEAGELFAQTYYDDGTTTRWEVKADAQALVSSGSWPKSGAALRVRYTATIVDLGNTIEGKWEQ